MEDIRIGYFVLEEGASTRLHWWNRWKPSVVTVDMAEEESLYCIRIPEYDKGKQRWQVERLRETLETALPQRECQEWYLQPALARRLMLDERLPSFGLLQRLLRQITRWEHLIYIGVEEEWDEDIRLLDLIQEYLPQINEVTLVTGRPQAYQELAEEIYEAYGIPTATVLRLEKSLGKANSTVILDGRKEYRIPYPVLPERAIYVDLWSEEKKREILAKMRRDITYMSIVKFLDTLVKNGYNTIVN
ncbi:MAG: hypothetical protein IKM28_03510 [Lachnospiraceae bacterium]|nr:hypothetical protein [Lachnospiraceae bacterium]